MCWRENRNKLVEWKALVDSVGIEGADLEDKFLHVKWSVILMDLLGPDIFSALVLTKKLMFDKTYEKIGVAGSHFSTHGHAISLFVVVTTEWKAIECEY